MSARCDRFVKPSPPPSAKVARGGQSTGLSREVNPMAQGDIVQLTVGGQSDPGCPAGSCGLFRSGRTVARWLQIATLGVFVAAGVSGAEAAAPSCPPTGRVLELVNECSEPILVGALGNGGSTCQSNSDCPANQYCSPIVSFAPAACTSGTCPNKSQTCNTTTHQCECMLDSECPQGQFCDSGTHTCAFRQCTFVPLGGAAGSTTTPCTQNGQCTSSQYCDTGTGTCKGVPTNGNAWSLAALGKTGNTATVCAPTPWAGRLWPRTGCTISPDGTKATCDTGQCLGADGKTFSVSCASSGVPPATLAELNMAVFNSGNASASTDFYDVSNVDGPNVGIALLPDPASYDILTNGGVSTTSCTNTSDCASLGSSWHCDSGLKKCVNVFQCGSPGCTTGSCTASGLKAALPTCGWGGAGVNLAVARSACVTALQVTNSTGAYVGCLAPQHACGVAAPPSSLNCSQNLSLYACSGANAGSCFTNQKCQTSADCANLPPGFTCSSGQCVDPQCCGCPSWAPAGTCAAGNNPTWVANAQPYASVFNAACPTAYSFPYDDVVKEFTCLGKSAEQNVGYKIVFCPSQATPRAGR